MKKIVVFEWREKEKLDSNSIDQQQINVAIRHNFGLLAENKVIGYPVQYADKKNIK